MDQGKKEDEEEQPRQTFQRKKSKHRWQAVGGDSFLTGARRGANLQQPAQQQGLHKVRGQGACTQQVLQGQPQARYTTTSTTSTTLLHPCGEGAGPLPLAPLQTDAAAQESHHGVGGDAGPGCQEAPEGCVAIQQPCGHNGGAVGGA